MSGSQIVCSILKLDPLNYRTCVGLKRGGLPCYNPVAQASRETAYRVLGTCEDLPTNSRTLQKRFQKAAGLLLCKRWHQDQCPDIVDEWIDIWEAHEDSYSEDDSEEEEEEEVPSTISSNIRRHSPQQATEHVQLNSEETAYQRLVRSILDSTISSEAKIAILQTATTATERGDSTSQTLPSSSSSVAESAGAADTRSPSPSPASAHSESSTAGSVILTPTRSGSTTSSSSNIDNVDPLPHDNITSPLRQTHDECGICTEPYDSEHGTTFWECQQCRNRTHQDCQDTWSVSQSDAMIVKCVYCRAAV